MSKMGKIGYFGVQNQHFLTFLIFFSTDVSKIMPDNRHLEVSKGDCFGC